MKICIEQGDITTYAVDAIVNAANCSLNATVRQPCSHATV